MDDDNVDKCELLRGDISHKATVEKAMDHLHLNGNDFLLFLAPCTKLDLSMLHPAHVHIFKFWHVYLDAVNPLLKVTHTPTLQASLIDAASNLSHVDPTLEALMFSVYCVATLSLTESACLTMFGASRAELMATYQIGCREALLRCNFLHSDSRNCLTALYLYLASSQATLTIPLKTFNRSRYLSSRMLIAALFVRCSVQ